MLSRNELSPEFGFFEKRLLLGPETQPTPADVTAETATAMKTRRLNRMSWFIQKRIELEGDFGGRMLWLPLACDVVCNPYS
ncbi:MAG: hypothetical protein CMM01_04910 [Rhodopirellula sp.]|nr:hypothetical protein [Rhodopirellula sp.]